MIKQISFFKRKAGVSVDDFQVHWRTLHADLVRRLPGLRRYVQNHTLASGYARHEPDYDGVAEAWFDTTDDMRATVGTAELEAIRADEHNFIDRSSMGTILTTEVLIIDGPAPADACRSSLLPSTKSPSDQRIDQWTRAIGPATVAPLKTPCLNKWPTKTKIKTSRSSAISKT
jgi:uncharacterized protein (TIGR02118 family)